MTICLDPSTYGCFLKWWYPPISHPKTIVLMVENPMGWLGKPTILGNLHIDFPMLDLLRLKLFSPPTVDDSSLMVTIGLTAQLIIAIFVPARASISNFTGIGLAQAPKESRVFSLESLNKKMEENQKMCVFFSIPSIFITKSSHIGMS